MKVVGLFAGVGGFELGLGLSGHHTICMSEILPAAQAVLSTRFPQVEQVGDVRFLVDLPGDTEVVVAGFPCQDLSQAGLTRGLDGDRSGLVSEIFRLAHASRPPWIVLENVPFMLRLRNGDAMRRIVVALEDLGYQWAWRTVDTFGFGLPHRRERVFLIASREGHPADVLLADNVPFARPETAIGHAAHGFYWTEGRGGLGWAPNGVPTLKNGSTLGIPSPPAILLPDGLIIKPDIRDGEHLQGFPTDWTLPAELVTRPGFRWSLIGSAVSVPVAEWLGKRLNRPGNYDRATDRVFPSSGKLPRSARSDGRKWYAVDISNDPVGIHPGPLAEFLQFPGTLLSVRATRGFLERTRTAKLRFPPGFIPAVEKHLNSILETVGNQIPVKRVA